MQPLTPAQQQLVTDNRRLAEAVLKRMNIRREGKTHARDSGWDDMLSTAYEALCAAAQTYDAARGAFSGWAWRKIRWAIADALTQANKARRVPETEAADSFDAQPGETWPELASYDPSPLDALEASALNAAVRGKLATAPQLVRDVALLAIGGATKDESARRLGVGATTIVRRRADVRALLAPLREVG
jgi:RNA polymerase sigma factor (sigma-70 family)